MTLMLSAKALVCPIIIGRDPVLELLDHHIARAREGQCEILALAGEAGIGKSRLVAEAKARATRLGMTILEGRCFEPDRALPYAPILDLFRAFKTEHSIETLELVLGSAAPILAGLLPELASASPLGSPIAQLARERQTWFESITQVFLRFATDAPILLILEDLHWSDDVSLEFLLYAVRRLASQPIMLLLTFRSDEANPSLNHLIDSLNRRRLASEITLTRLTPVQVDLMIRKIFELERRVPQDILDTIYNLTEGIPFFVEEVLKSLSVVGEIVRADGQWNRKTINEWHIPPSLQDVVQRGVAQLSERARRMVTIAAVAGRQFDFDLLQELGGMSEQELLEQLKELVAAQLVVEESNDQFSFRHALTRLAVYETLLRRERQNLHREIAQAQERASADSITTILSDLSYHFFEGGLWSQALEYSSRAGEQALALYAPREAIGHFTRAIKSAQALALTASSHLYRARGHAYETIGDLRAASTDYAVALTAARESGDAVSQWQSLIDLGFLWASRDYAKTGEYFQQALALAHTTRDRAALAYSLNRIGNWHTNIGMHLEAIPYHQEAMTIFQDLDDHRGLAQTLDLLGLAHMDASDLIQGTAYLERSIALSRELDDRSSLASSLATITMGGVHNHCDTVVLAYSGNENVKHGEEALKISREIGWRAGEAYALLELGFSLTPRGDFARARQAAQNAIAIAEEIEHSEWLAGALCALGSVELDLLDLPSARQYLERALALATEIGSRIWLPTITGFLAQAYLWDNNIAQAKSVLDAALGSTPPSRSRAQRLCWCMRAEIALHEDKPAQALEIIDQLIASTPNRTEQTVIPRLWMMRAGALAAQRRYSEAEHLLHAAEETAFTQGTLPLLWQIHIAEGELYRAQSQRDNANNQFDAARRIVQDLAARIEDVSVRENFIARARVRIPRGGQLSQRQSKKNESAGLTAREREVVSLIALGKSNREIAAMLVITERTVGAHVGNILAKLGLTSRTQIAAWAIQKRPVPK